MTAPTKLIQLVAFSLAVVSCDTGILSFMNEAPTPHEAASRANLLDGDPVTWEHLSKKEKTSFNTDWFEAKKEIPWTYQGLLWRDRSLAFRINGVDFRHDFNNPDRDRVPDLAAYMNQFVEIMNSRDATLIGSLSEAEKYDVALNLAQNPEYLSSQRFSTIISAINELANSLAKTPDGEKRLALMKEFMEGDTGGGRAFREDFPLVVDGWHKYAYFASDSRYPVDGGGDNQPGTYWSWMGHCNGWATAAAFETEPKYAVRANIGGRDILFLQHDIRSLLVKTWTHHLKHPMLGTKCELDTKYVGLDAKNSRMLDGFFCDGKDLAGCFQRSHYRDNATWFSNYKEFGQKIGSRQYLGFTFNKYHTRDYESGKSDQLIADKDPKVLYALPYYVERNKIKFVQFNSLRDRRAGLYGHQTIRGKVYRFLYTYIFESQEELEQFVLNPDQNRQRHIMHMTRCRDLNPMTFHLMLAEYLNDGKKGRRFVIDNTPAKHVWNVPVFGYNTTFLSHGDAPTALDTQWLSTPKDPRDDPRLTIATPDTYPMFETRAPGTIFVARLSTDVIAQTSISAKKPPYLDFKLDNGEDADAVEVKDLKTQYYLEFDRKGTLIGGEWDPEGMFDDTTSSNKRRIADYVISFNDIYRADDIEKHLFNYFKDMTITLPMKGTSKSTNFKQDLIRRLHRCSISNQTPKVTQVNVRGEGLQDVEYVECEL